MEFIKEIANTGIGTVALAIVFYLCKELISFMKSFIVEMKCISESVKSLVEDIRTEHGRNIERQEKVTIKLNDISNELERQVLYCNANERFKQQGGKAI